MSHAHHPSRQDAHPHDDHGHGIGKYIVVFVALCILTGASFFTYSSYWPFHETPQIAWAFMTAVSCTKAMLVILFFMHVKYEANWKYVLTIPASMMSIFLVLALVPDVGARVNGLLGYQGKYSTHRLQHAASPADKDVMLRASAASSDHSSSDHSSSDHSSSDHSSSTEN